MMAEYTAVTVERFDHVARVTMNRPDQLNAFNADLRSDLLKAIREVNEDDSIRVVILTGAGRAFCAGADLSEQVPAGSRVDDQLNHEYKPALLGITEASKPWISAVNGAAAGIGSAFDMACDLSIMGEKAFLYQAFTAIGLVPDGGSTWLLARTVGRKLAYQLMIEGTRITGDRALELGLVNKVVADDDLQDAALDWAKTLAGKSPLSLSCTKEALNAAMECDFGTAISVEADLQMVCVASEDAREGAMAFFERRAPVWKGR